MAYCVTCGQPNEEDTSRICTACLSKEEVAVAKEVTQQSSTLLQENIEFLKQAFINPERCLVSLHRIPVIIPGIIYTLFYSLFFSAIFVLLIEKGINEIKRMIPFLGGLNRSDVPYGELFFKIFLILLLQYLVLTLVTFGVMKLWKRPVSFIQIANIVGITKIYLVVTIIVTWIFSSLSLYLAFLILIAGVLFGYVAIQQALQPLLQKVNREIYILPTILVVYWLVEGILVKLSM